jgi:hypothetical protein
MSFAKLHCLVLVSRPPPLKYEQDRLRPRHKNLPPETCVWVAVLLSRGHGGPHVAWLQSADCQRRDTGRNDAGGQKALFPRALAEVDCGVA